MSRKADNDLESVTHHGEVMLSATLFPALLAFFRQAYFEAGDTSNGRNAEADLRAYISSRGTAVTAKLFKKTHPDIWH